MKAALYISCSKADIIDIGFRGGDPDAVPITESAIGIELGYPGYDGTHLPFPDESQDTVLAAHVLEHIPNYRDVLAEWYRVLRIGGYLVIIVPTGTCTSGVATSDALERRSQEIYTPASLLTEIEESLPVNGYRVRHMFDNDDAFNYRDPLEAKPTGSYEIELVLERITRPDWADQLVYPETVRQMLAKLDSVVFQAVAANLRDPSGGSREFFEFIGALHYFTPWARLHQRFVVEGAPEMNGAKVADKDLRSAVRPLLDCLTVDEAVYGRHVDLQAAMASGNLRNLTSHWRTSGYFEGRVGHEYGVFARP